MGRSHEYIFECPRDVLDAFYYDRSYKSIISSPLGSAKTTRICYKQVAWMREQEPNWKGIRPTRSIAIRNKLPELRNTMARDFITVFEDMGAYKLY